MRYVLLSCSLIIALLMVDTSYSKVHDQLLEKEKDEEYAEELLIIATDRAARAIELSRRFAEQDADLKRRLETAENEIPHCGHTALVHK